MNRKDLVSDLQNNKDKVWDVIVIGGGATGLGIALDAVTRGYSTILLEQSDFAKATSSRSTKLVHGGVRYLAQGDVLLVKEALRERGIMLKNAPHLTGNQEFIIPVYSVWDVILYTVGLKFYDILSGSLSLGSSYFINRKKTLERLPLLQPEKLKGGVVYHDGQFDDSRMAVALASACVDKGGTVLNYFRVNSILKDGKGRVSGVKAENLETHAIYDIKAKVVINATGVFADVVHRMDEPNSKPTIRPSQGVHLVLDKTFLQSESALMIPKTDDGRVLFAIPWYGKVVVGTTDTPLDDISTEPKALDEEIEFILRNAGKYLIKPPSRLDALCIFAGLRPLAADPENPASTKEVSRRHKIVVSGSGLISIIGGKWTSYRRMAEETINRAIKEGMLDKVRCVTKSVSLLPDDPHVHRQRLRIYGSKAAGIEELMCGDPTMQEQLSPALPYTKAEIIWICRNEMPLTLEDMLARRTRALCLDVRASLEIAPEAADIMAEELRRDGRWKQQQLEEYKSLTLNYI